ncbi:hypothetical protein [Methylobacterium sp. J-090]|uniref:hypothetical protein n=1 Tax=Methylobacterium sp. J-090 TaxID=2836666 RepID=UPI001FBB33F9|nr:hypothetical protein [Methylobacterium sp. J-090]MCJ2079859.1 hypothetical protein [Methylobacterium sp. J-090]
MTHARIPDFSTRLPVTSTVDHVPAFADPILTVIDAHAEAYAVFQVAPEGKPSERAEIAMGDALDALLAASCATRFGGLALLRHLNWWLAEEAEFADHYQPAYALAQARADDLTLFLGSDISSVEAVASRAERLSVPVSRVVLRIATRKGQGRYAGPPPFTLDDDETQPGSIEPWQAVAPIRPDTDHVRSLRLLDGMGEAFSALTLICAGALFIGLATLA